MIIQGEYNSADPTLTEGQSNPLRLDEKGNLKVTSAATTDTSSTFDHGSNLDVDNTAEALTSTSFSCNKGVVVKAAKDNTGYIYVGNSDVTDGDTVATDGFELGAGESIFVEVSNPNLIYVIASEANQAVFWLAS